MLSFYAGGHVLFQLASTCYHYSSSFLAGEMKEISEMLQESETFLFPHLPQGNGSKFKSVLGPQDPTASLTTFLLMERLGFGFHLLRLNYYHLLSIAHYQEAPLLLNISFQLHYLATGPFPPCSLKMKSYAFGIGPCVYIHP